MKKKILLLSDDMRFTSGIATMSREIVLGTSHKYDWVQLGSANNHLENGKIILLDDDVRARTGVADASVRIYANNGYGDILTIRKLLDTEKPDAIMHFTDPHYWQWLYDNEHEIRQRVPLLYYHVWDDLPDPVYNKNYYESCDWIGCISKQTYGIVKRVGALKKHSTQTPLEDWQVSYVPHGINENVFKPLPNVDANVIDAVVNGKRYDFILFYNNRNIRRKQPSDVVYAYKLFCDSLPKDVAKRCLLLFHTTPVDPNGTDLPAVIDALCPDYDIKFTTNRVEPDMLNQIYNLVDCTINIANNEGFGLATAESLMSGTPTIVTVTGGLQDQCGFDYSADDYIKIGSLHDKKLYGSTPHGEWSFPIWGSAFNINGSPATPYIFDDRVNVYDVVDTIKKVYELGREERKRRGLLGREFMIKNLSSSIMCEKMIEGIDAALENYKPRKRFGTYRIV